MKTSGLPHHLVGVLFIIGLLLVSASCVLVGEVDRVGEYSGSTAAAVRLPPRATNQPAETAPQTEAAGPLKITPTEAILLALENNRSLVVERLNPSIDRTFEETERALFDPEANAEFSAERIDGERLARAGSDTESFTADSAGGAVSLHRFFPTGTTLSVEGSTQIDDSSLYEDRFYWTRLGMSLNQAILRGYGSDVNLANLRQARLDTRLSEYELRGFTQSLVARVEDTYWDYALAERRVEIFEESLKVARQQLSETRELIAVGRLAKSELAAVQAEVAAEEQGLINARSRKESIRLRLLRLLNPPGPDLWTREINLIHQPSLPEVKLEKVESHVKVSKLSRPVMNQARLQVLRDDLEVVKTRNGLLPLMDLFITLGKSGYANSFGSSMENIDGDRFDALAGIRFQYPIHNREAGSRHRRAVLRRDQAEKALENLSQLVEVDVRTAYIEVNRTKQQIDASTATRRFDEETLRIETEKLRVGKSTSFLVAQAQRDLLISKIEEVQAVVDYIKALINLYEQDGSLLNRRGIDSPGQKPVRLPGG